MDDFLANSIVKLKTEFAKTYKRNSPLQEIIPVRSSELFTVDENELVKLHAFAKNNPMYSNSYDLEICGVLCRIYEGDINQYWIDSIKHDTSYAPFYPTWVLSAYALALASKKLGFEQVIDVGSGDGRIAFCAKVVGIESHGIEIDENLVTLQKSLASDTGIDFHPNKADATRFDYESLNLTRPALFISGLPEIGEMLANKVIEKIMSVSSLKGASTFVLTGTNVFRESSRDRTKWGWGTIIDNFGLDVIDTITLPTRWTVDQPENTPYVFTKFK